MGEGDGGDKRRIIDERISLEEVRSLRQKAIQLSMF